MIRYRAEIDGLRAVAVIPVVLFHAGASFASGGYVGVDVFFVISGYLISSIILSEIESGTFSLFRFYERRARRILPALFLIVVICIPVAWLILLPIDMKDFSQSVAAVGMFSSNFLFWMESGYFDSSAEMKPLLHTWSLAIEEQFYLIFPILFVVLLRFRLHVITILLISTSAASLLLAEWASHRLPTASFYLLPTRAWELLLGVGATMLIRYRSKIGTKFAQPLSLLGLSLIVFAVTTFDNTTPIPGLLALLPTMGAVLVILFAREGTLVQFVLRHQVVVTVGLMSYSIYLWHYPILAFARHHWGGEIPLAEKSLLLMAIVPLAALSWHFVERPFRRREKLRSRTIAILATAATFSFVAIGAFGHVDRGNFFRFDGAQVLIAERALNSGNPRQSTCRPEIGAPIRLPIAECWYGSGDYKLLVWGDSHNDSISLALAEEIPEATVYHAAYTACPPSFGIVRIDRQSDCGEFNQRVLDWASEQRFDAVYLGARWRLYAEGVRFDNQEGGVESFLAVFAADDSFETEDERIESVAESYVASAARIAAELAPATIFLAHQIPEVGVNVPNAYLSAISQGIDPSTISSSYSVYREVNERVAGYLDRIEVPNLIRLYPHKVLCDTQLPDRCMWVSEDEILYKDDDHLSMEGARLLATEFAKTIRPFIDE